MTRRRALSSAFAAAAALALVSCGGVAPYRTAFNRGAYLASQGDLEAAIREYREALADDESDFRARFNLASTLEDLSDVRRKEGRNDEALKAKNEATAHYERILADRPNDLRASCNLAATLFEEADATNDPALEARAAALLKSAAEASPGSALPIRALAVRRFRKGDPKSAEEEALRALAIDGADPETNYLLGELAAARGEFDLALLRFRRGLSASPDDVAALLSVGRVEASRAASFEAEGRTNEAAKARAEAITHLRRVAMIRRDNYEAHASLAALEEAEGDYRAAAAHLVLAQKLDDRRLGGERPDYGARLAALYERLAAEAKAASERPPDGSL
jgi:tetratricopeptide (TPR) repeat protein